MPINVGSNPVLLESQAQIRTTIFAWSGSVIVILWSATGLAAARAFSALETLEAAGLLLGLLVGMLACRGLGRMADTASGRLFAVGFFLFGAILSSPVFHRSFATGTFTGAGIELLLATWAPFALILALWLAARGNATALPVRLEKSFAANLEQFLRSPATQLNLAFFGVLAVTVGMALSGLSLKSALARSVTLAAAIFAARPLLDFVRMPAGARVLNGAMLITLLVSVVVGGAQYAKLWAHVEAGNQLLTAPAPNATEAKTIHDEARALNKVVFAKAPELSIETHWAAYYEQTGDYWQALTHWNQVADMQRLNRAEFRPSLRLQCKLGDSVMIWRRFIFQGFPAINDRELAPGIKTLSNTAPHDLRARLLAALLAWELNDPEQERRQRLEDVQRLCPNEPSSYTLLKRMGAALSSTSFTIPNELLIGEKATFHSTLGTLNELGELRTVVVLNRGPWELGVSARGTPMNEEWPIIRVLLDNVEIGRTQVTRCEDHEVAFTFDINHAKLYHVRIIFENRREELSQGHFAMRNLVVNHLRFRCEKTP
ncbi:MAG: carbohydrate-binding domain-containing protein [Planctomycetota bacterium]